MTSHAITWIPGSCEELDAQFHEYREMRFNDHSHRLWENYSAESFNDAIALTMYLQDNVPILFSSICKKDCWPNNVFRVLNRMWKPQHAQVSKLKRISVSVGESIKSQLQWINTHYTDPLMFCSRQTFNWEQWTIELLASQFGVYFETDKYLYLTCSNTECNTCWQKIIFTGNESLLLLWNRKLLKT